MANVILGKTNRHPLLGSDIDPKDFKSLSDNKFYKYYKKNGGKLPEHRYKALKKIIFTKFMEHILLKGSRLDVPYFGELFVQETQVPVRQSKSNIKRNNNHIAELLLQRYNHSRAPMNLYQDVELTLLVNARLEGSSLNKRTSYKFTNPYKKNIQKIAIKARRINPDVKFVKSYKKHEDYIYPDD